MIKRASYPGNPWPIRLTENLWGGITTLSRALYVEINDGEITVCYCSESSHQHGNIATETNTLAGKY